jgi:sugar phosphate isomerase/epimerase
MIESELAPTVFPPEARAPQDAASEVRRRLRDRLGLNVPYEWWPRAAALKAIEAAGFQWVQVASPPVEMLADPRHVIRHGRALRRSLEVTRLRTVVHGPTNLRLGSSLHNRAGEGLVEYAHEIGAGHVVYHALDVRRHGPETEAEERALRFLTRWAETLDVVLCLENLCPVYPAGSSICHDPLAVHALVRRMESSAVKMLLDVGHAHVVADLHGFDLSGFVAPVLDAVGLFHIHDNLGARRRATGGPALDPLRLDLHLSPGGGTLPWASLARALTAHDAPLMLEIHPSHRPSATALLEASEAALFGGPCPSTASLESLRGPHEHI